MLYVFDCDGVLVDSEIIASQVDAEHLTRLGYAITAEEVTIRFAGLTARELGAIVEVEIGHPPLRRPAQGGAGIHGVGRVGRLAHDLGKPMVPESETGPCPILLGHPPA